MSLVRSVKLRVAAGNAKPGPAIGQALGPLGVNMAEFCKQFNAATEPLFHKDVPLSVTLNAMSDRSFTFNLKTPPTSWLIKQAIGMEKGPGRPNLATPTAYIAPEVVYEIAQIKKQDEILQFTPLKSVCRSVIGTCRTLGVAVREVEEDEDEKPEEAAV
uniref:Large ribosomal subunit protein uL11m n=1 Tax=Entomoneis paludosa TaxID=265537 RepID=A0A7S2VBS7_9STRA|mmetsp:Transcript_1215/g.2661  ORF Transcript_1215/g.2661 Transcript_1215/m.2661 type:complete len:159 (+) Transcript_1215:140-616(+)|eukprot:CAMPEP_0172456194 /NCGR_PEP_ID=MMETSP1065-20121228/14262_1 /TAXON_ID=265537 /ORGANISM="Amphiprora paludosa, Strain CCMP125" /LENGTH=158 /DNA_ID=CAMNT_0013208915 /DNA_START=114 /DNA_END=590 /DNA_ORIENTATION=+